MDFWLCSGLSILLLNQNTEYDVSLLGSGKELATNHWVCFFIDTVTTA
jgi:hypothetical protein